jgi:hypothetical protein
VRALLLDLLSFARALWNEWKALLTGGSIIALLWLATVVTKRTIPPNVNWLAVGLTLILAAFLAWRKEWIANGKGFISRTPEQLTKLARDVTDVAAASRIRPYMKKWVKVTGTLKQVSHFGPIPVTFIRLEYERGGGLGIGINFTTFRWKSSPFIPLPSGTTVTVAGRISEINSYEMKLSNVEFINAEDQQASQPDPQSPPPSQE